MDGYVGMSTTVQLMLCHSHTKIYMSCFLRLKCAACCAGAQEDLASSSTVTPVMQMMLCIEWMAPTLEAGTSR